jgi:vitamin B12 transporter
LLGIYTHRTTDFVDKSKWVYDWYGERVNERRVPGEIDSDPTDQTIWQNSLYARAMLAYDISPGHVARLSSAAMRPSRTGDERIQADPSARDPLSAKRDLFTLVSGLEYELNLFPTRAAPEDPKQRRNGTDYILQNSLFGKSYLYKVDSEEPLPGGTFRERDKDLHRFGIGDGVRVVVTD